MNLFMISFFVGQSCSSIWSAHDMFLISFQSPS